MNQVMKNCSDTNNENKNKLKKEFLLLDDIWIVVKEFAGIYDIKTKWSRFDIGPLNKLEKTLFSFKSKKEWGFGDMSWERGNIKERRCIMWKKFWYFHRKSPFTKEVFESISETLEPKKRNIWKPPSHLNIGQEIIFRIEINRSYKVFRRWCCGIINKINNSSINVNVYDYITIENAYSMCYPTPWCELGNETYIWDKTKVNYETTIKGFDVGRTIFTQEQVKNNVFLSRVFDSGINDNLYFTTHKKYMSGINTNSILPPHEIMYNLIK